MSGREEEELLKKQAVERRQLPKHIRSEMKTRELIFRESLRLSIANLTNNEDEKGNLFRTFFLNHFNHFNHSFFSF